MAAAAAAVGSAACADVALELDDVAVVAEHFAAEHWTVVAEHFAAEHWTVVAVVVVVGAAVVLVDVVYACVFERFAPADDDRPGSGAVSAAAV